MDSIIIGARTLDQLGENLAALELALDDEEISNLDIVSAPRLNFPSAFLEKAQIASYGGMTINGRSFPVNTLHDVDSNPVATVSVSDGDCN